MINKMFNQQERQALAQSMLSFPKDKQLWALQTVRERLHMCDEQYFVLKAILEEEIEKRVDKL